MERSEAALAQLENEGFAEVYEWFDEPGITYAEHRHSGKVSLIVVEGSITFMLPERQIKLGANDRLDVPINTPHRAVVGLQGCKYVVGQMDSHDE
jgi:quercetin dioxygenase-like cupin family protein